MEPNPSVFLRAIRRELKTADLFGAGLTSGASRVIVERGAEILAQLGYKPVFRYEKYRTEWEAGAGHIFLDETPIGVYAELEGPPEWIESMREQLGIKPEQCTTESYGMLFLDWKGRMHSPAENLTFDEIPSPLATV